MSYYPKLDLTGAEQMFAVFIIASILTFLVMRLLWAASEKTTFWWTGSIGISIVNGFLSVLIFQGLSTLWA